jgi:hypothetical protein
VYRVAVWVLPLIVFLVTRRVCVELQELERLRLHRRESEKSALELG